MADGHYGSCRRGNLYDLYRIIPVNSFTDSGTQRQIAITTNHQPSSQSSLSGHAHFYHCMFFRHGLPPT